MTGRRRAEAIGLTAGDITTEGTKAFYSYRGKGGTARAARPALDAIAVSLSDADSASQRWPPGSPSGRRGLGSAGSPFEPLQPAAELSARRRRVRERRPISSGTVQPSSAVGESIESVSQFLDHSSLAVTTVYLRRLEGQEDPGWGKVADAIGV